MSGDSEERITALVPLFILAVVCSLVITFTHSLLLHNIEANQRAMQLALVTEVMSLNYDNDLLADMLVVRDKNYFYSTHPVRIYRARNKNHPVGVVFMPVRVNGYNGPIELAVGISYTGELTGVRIHKHRETQGLGDQVHQDNSNWISGFDGRSLTNTANESWAVVSEGGEFDQLSGATITPRAIIIAVKNVLDYYEINKLQLY